MLLSMNGILIFCVISVVILFWCLFRFWLMCFSRVVCFLVGVCDYELKVVWVVRIVCLVFFGVFLGIVFMIFLVVELMIFRVF